ncbi:polysaccharide export outer membrane protein [Novosphingobium sp. PhB57]|uniref:polysaccharide biosynthesis/export family protein n=1 Tax=Novosphingobium sp. PhB57 TaxID=2485107 RepID=UPI0010E5905C|nr:polysaccharide biosynthesis/export family protein [Novosphingobium sp. PhB57]TCU51472.1 polysaccharide export outer membrane protein [Novosphingobium sp. PhB57]
MYKKRWAQMVRPGMILLSATAISGCATLPRNGPTGSQIARDAQEENDIGFQIVDIGPRNIDALSNTNAPSGALSALSADGLVDTLGPGDVLSIEIYEVGVTLFGGRASIAGPGSSAGDEAAPSANAGTIGQGGVVVDRYGEITVPYVGPISVKGLTTSQVQDRIVAGLRGKSQSPQVVVTLRKNVSNTIVVMGAVSSPGRFALSLARERLLDVIADTGGISRNAQTGSSTATGTGTQDVIVRFTRHGRTVEQPLDTVISGSNDDLTLLGGDRIELIRQPRTFTVFGALDRISQIPFESRTLTLAEALARAGGPNDSRADPRSVFVFRMNSSPARIGTEAQPPENTQTSPVAYRINMMRAQNYFLAQQFMMHDKDVIYIANASANQPLKVVQALGQLFSPVIAIQNATR